MRPISLCALIPIPASILILILLSTPTSTTRYLNLTTSAARNNASVIECWQLATPFTLSTQKGTTGTQTLALGDLARGSYSIIPAGTNDGPHVAPANQYALFLSGSARVSIPNSNSSSNSTQSALLSAGKNGLVFAADTAALSATGHITAFIEDTVLLQIPVQGGRVPEHRVLYEGGCRGEELLR